MELDKRIKALTDIQSVTSILNNRDLDKKGYFADHIAEFKDLSKCMYGEFVEYREHEQCFLCEIDHYDGTFDHTYYRYFIPEDSLLPEVKPEKKYRPFSLNEFLERFKIGNTVTFRFKKGEHVPEEECRVEYTNLITGYETLPENRDIPGKSSILLGGCPPISLARLFEFYELENEYYFPTVWQPFGVLDKENE